MRFEWPLLIRWTQQEAGPVLLILGFAACSRPIYWDAVVWQPNLSKPLRKYNFHIYAWVTYTQKHIFHIVFHTDFAFEFMHAAVYISTSLIGCYCVVISTWSYSVTDNKLLFLLFMTSLPKANVAHPRSLSRIFSWPSPPNIMPLEQARAKCILIFREIHPHFSATIRTFATHTKPSFYPFIYITSRLHLSCLIGNESCKCGCAFQLIVWGTKPHSSWVVYFPFYVSPMVFKSTMWSQSFLFNYDLIPPYWFVN